MFKNLFSILYTLSSVATPNSYQEKEPLLNLPDDVLHHLISPKHHFSIQDILNFGKTSKKANSIIARHPIMAIQSESGEVYLPDIINKNNLEFIQYVPHIISQNSLSIEWIELIRKQGIYQIKRSRLDQNKLNIHMMSQTWLRWVTNNHDENLNTIRSIEILIWETSTRFARTFAAKKSYQDYKKSHTNSLNSNNNPKLQTQFAIAVREALLHSGSQLFAETTKAYIRKLALNSHWKYRLDNSQFQNANTTTEMLDKKWRIYEDKIQNQIQKMVPKATEDLEWSETNFEKSSKILYDISCFESLLAALEHLPTLIES